MLWRFSCKNFTVGVCTDPDGKIIASAPLVQKFVGQNIKNLQRWMEKKFGRNHTAELLTGDDDG